MDKKNQFHIGKKNNTILWLQCVHERLTTQIWHVSHKNGYNLKNIDTIDFNPIVYDCKSNFE